MHHHYSAYLQRACKAVWLSVLIGVTFAMVPGSTLAALVLTFDQNPPFINPTNIDQSYGDRVTSTTMPGNFLYGQVGTGFTPNIVVDYGGPPTVVPRLWTTGYGDLVNVLFDDQDGLGQLEITFTADPGFLVSLERWDMAAFGGSDLLINAVRVLDAANGNAVLDEQLNLVISGTGHNTFDFSANPFQSSSLILAFNTANLGFLSDNIAFDNIQFSQVGAAVPAPSAMLLFGSGLVGLVGWRWWSTKND